MARPDTPRMVKRAGLAVLALGWIAAGAVFFAATPAADADLVAQQREMREVARLGGTATVQTVKFKLWFDSLWRGRSLALTLAVLALVAAGGCGYVGALMDESVDE